MRQILPHYDRADLPLLCGPSYRRLGCGEPGCDAISFEDEWREFLWPYLTLNVLGNLLAAGYQKFTIHRLVAPDLMISINEDFDAEEKSRKRKFGRAMRGNST